MRNTTKHTGKDLLNSMSEDAVQRGVVTELDTFSVWDLNDDGDRVFPFYFHVPNGGSRTKAEAGKFKSMGVVAGVPDLMIIWKGTTYALELKRSKSEGRRQGAPSKLQLSALAALSDNGAKVAIAYGLTEAKAQLREWGLITDKPNGKSRIAADKTSKRVLEKAMGL